MVGWIYVAHMTTGDVTAFRTGAGGTPTRLGSWAAGRRGAGTFVVALSRDGRRLWAANALSNDIAAFTVALYVGGDGPGAVAAFRVRRSGALEALGEPTPTPGNGSEAIALTGDRRWLLVANFNKGEPEGSVTIFRVHRDGTLGRRQAQSASAAPSPTSAGWSSSPTKAQDASSLGMKIVRVAGRSFRIPHHERKRVASGLLSSS